MSVPYTAPGLDRKAFNCPHCNAFANQIWDHPVAGRSYIVDLRIAFCAHCRYYSLWVGTQMVYPGGTAAPVVNADTPAAIVADYNEAREIVARSPRGAAALLRLCLQKLCAELGEPGKDINRDIGNLVKKGLPETIQ